MAQARSAQTMKTSKEKKTPKIQTEQTMLIRCLLYGFVDYSGKGTKSFDVLTGDREVRTATYQPGIGQSQHAKFVSHIIRGIKELYWKQ